MTDPDLDKLRELTEEQEKFSKLPGARNYHRALEILVRIHSDPTHFIYELIQNADDAEAKKIHFEIKDEEIRVSHDGKPFTIEDIESITGSGNSTKKDKDNKIGKFGIGFKSVFVVTTKPKIHSGKFNFEIEDYIIPRELKSQKNDETIFVLPLDKETPASEIIEKINQFAQESLLFLNDVEEIKFSSAGKDHTYRAKELSSSRRSISSQDGETTYLFFKGDKVKIAYQIEKEEEKEKITSKESNKLFVFFPTDKEAHFGFLAHAPYQTAPGRETIDFTEENNQRFTQGLAELFYQSLKKIKQEGFLTAEFFDLLPLDENYETDHPAAIIYEKFLEEIQNKPLLPKHGGGYVKAGEARLGRSVELRELFSPAQLGAIHGQDKIEWISGAITSKLHLYLKRIDMKELDWSPILPKLTKDFLEKQNNDWIRRLYEAFNQLGGLLDKMKELPLIRSEKNSKPNHVFAKEEIFLPLKGNEAKKSGFLIVCRAVCNTNESREFLEKLGLHEFDEVADVIKNTLSNYVNSDNSISGSDYENDISYILKAHETDSTFRKEALEKALSDKYFIKAINADGDAEKMAKPEDVYMHTASLTSLFSGVKDIFFVNNSYLKGEDAQSLLRACKVAQYLRPVEVEDPDRFTYTELREMRDGEGSSGAEQIIDYMIPGLEDILKKSPNEKGLLLWKALSDYIKQHGESGFFGKYTWFYYTQQSRKFSARFIEQLKESAWIPDRDGELKKPKAIIFSSTGWQPENDELVKLLGMRSATISEEVYQEQVVENEKLRAENAELKEKLAASQPRPERETIPQSSNWEPAVDPNDAKPKIFEVKPYNPHENVVPQRRASAHSNSSFTTQRDEDDSEQEFFPEENKKIGRWGEEFVYKELCEIYGQDNVDWHNKNSESGKSHDITIKGEQGDIFVEVKSTKEGTPHSFNFSGKQFQEIKDNNKNYIICAVFDCGTALPTLAVIKSPSGQLTPITIIKYAYALKITEQDLLRREALGRVLRSAD